MTTLFLILIVVVILTCILLNNISVRIGVPTLLAFIVLGIVFGVGFGWAIAKGASWALQRMHFSTDGFDTLFIFAVAIAAYAVPYLLGGNGYLSAYIACFAQKGGETIGCGGLCLHD